MEKKFDQYYEREITYTLTLEELEAKARATEEDIIAFMRLNRSDLTFHNVMNEKYEQDEVLKIKFDETVKAHHNPVMIEGENKFFDSFTGGWFGNYKIELFNDNYARSYYVTDLISHLSKGEAYMSINGHTVTFNH